MRRTIKHGVLILGLAFGLGSCAEDREFHTDLGEDSISGLETLSLGLTEKDMQLLAEKNVSAMTVFVYLNDSMVTQKELNLASEALTVDVPLGEKLKTFAVANAGSVIDADSLSTVVIYQDERCSKEVFISNIAEFTSDRTQPTVELSLTRRVGQAVFQPSESSELLAANTSFDELAVTFNSVITGYKVIDGSGVQDTITVSTNAAAGYAVEIYSFPTTSDNNPMNIEMVYKKSGAQVNKTSAPYEMAAYFAVSKRITISAPILNENFLESPFASLRTFSLPVGVQIQETEF
ncbi:MAG: hypothetical protein ACK5IJ_02685 [Mangrovibacterium sp.]